MKLISDDHRMQFAEGAESSSPTEEYRTQSEWATRGLKNFKRRVLGLCGRESVKSLDELVGILTEMKVIDSAEKGNNLIEGLYGKEANYGNGILEFTKVQNKEGNEACRINRYPCYDFFDL